MIVLLRQITFAVEPHLSSYVLISICCSMVFAILSYCRSRFTLESLGSVSAADSSRLASKVSSRPTFAKVWSLIKTGHVSLKIVAAAVHVANAPDILKMPVCDPCRETRSETRSSPAALRRANPSVRGACRKEAVLKWQTLSP